jgi:hypothetical protein
MQAQAVQQTSHKLDGYDPRQPTGRSYAILHSLIFHNQKIRLAIVAK